MATIYLYVLTLISMLFAALLAFQSNHVNRYKNNYYLSSIAFNSIILASELLSEFAEMYQWRTANIIASVLTYALCPFVLYSLVMMNAKNWGMKGKLFAIPAIVVAVGSITSQWTHYVFYVSPDNVYTRGTFFEVTLLVSAFYFGYVIVTSYEEYRDSDVHEIIFLMGIFATSAMGSAIQIIDTEIRSMWPTVAICLLLYYVFTLEMSAKYDFLTGVRNRNAFDRMKAKLNSGVPFGMVIFDINGLKFVNDTMGHEKGDQHIIQAARILVDSFLGYGKVYRIGGDEFALIFEKIDEKIIKKKFRILEQNIKKENKTKEGCQLSISYGIGIHKAEDQKTFLQVFETADHKMYEMKRKYYKEKASNLG